MYYLETADSMAQPFLHGSNTPHCSLQNFHLTVRLVLYTKKDNQNKYIKLVVVLYGYGTLPLPLREEHTLRFFDNRAVGGTFVPNEKKWREDSES
jgi:hypothetical protein